MPIAKPILGARPGVSRLSVLQRFCPICDRAFEPGEAVLRCTGCGVLHHPGCWVTNGGCATSQPHNSSPQALAYDSASPSTGAPAPHPGEGTRVVQPPPAEEPPTNEAAPPPPRFIHRELPPEVAPPIGSGPPRRYQPPREDPLPRKPLPRIYQRHRIFAYWYVPIAVLLALAVAAGVIFAAERLTGGSTPAAPPTSTPRAEPTATPPTFTTPAPSPSPSAVGATPSPAATTGPGRFSAGQRLVVTGTGDCLNVRVAPGTENDAIVCLNDGSEVTVTGGPQQAGNFTWWKVQTNLGEGWAVENYLSPRP